jgi:hypothetical protein
VVRHTFQLARCGCTLRVTSKTSFGISLVLLVCNDVFLDFSWRTGIITKTTILMYWSSLETVKDSKDELPFNFSCYNHSDRKKIVHKLFDCPSFGWQVTWLQTKNSCISWSWLCQVLGMSRYQKKADSPIRYIGADIKK